MIEPATLRRDDRACRRQATPSARERATAVRPGLLGCALALASCLFVTAPALADDKLKGEIIIEQSDQRYIELRRTLLNISDIPAEQQRRRLSADERSALGREWRETMGDGIYDRGDRAGRGQRRLPAGQQ